MYNAEDLQHNFEIEPLVDEFVVSVGGELIKKIIPSSPDFENADYLFRNDNVILELKSLQKDFADSEDTRQKILNLWDLWFSENSAKFGMIFRPNELPLRNRQNLFRVYSEPIRRVLKKANRQLRSTANKLGLSQTQNIILIVNDGLYSLQPEIVLSIILTLLQREFSSIHGFVYFTANRYVELPNDNYAHQLWIPSYSPSSDKSLPDFVNNLGSRWFEFLGEKIGGWNGPNIKTDDISIIRGVRNIKP